MPKLSAGIVLVRGNATRPEFLLVHPGGPYWQKKDLGSWSIPKGEYDEGEDPESVARREFEEELGVAVPDGPRLPLGALRQPSGKVVSAWAVHGDIAVDHIVSNTFEMIWPPRSGRIETFPEIDRAGFFTRSEAADKILVGQRALLDSALDALTTAGLL